jgi:hypothetical protein
MAKLIGLFLYIVKLRLKAGIVEGQKTSTIRQWLGKHVPAATNTQATIKVLEMMFSIRSVQSGYKRRELRFVNGLEHCWQGPVAHTKDRPVLRSERAPHGIKNVTVRQK